MSRVYLNLGSNIDRQKNICAGLAALQESFGELSLSSVYESDALGFAGEPFFNLAVALNTRLPVGELARQLRDLEYAKGRPLWATRFSSRTLDIDILTYDYCVGCVDGVDLPRAEILENAYVLWPLAELAPRERHPVNGMTYRELWGAYDKSLQSLCPVPFSWMGRELSNSAAEI